MHRDTSAAPVSPTRRRPLILVIDDEAVIAELLHDLLDAEGYAVRVAHDGSAGVACARETHPDLVVTDLMMPVLDGYAVCRQVRADPRTAHIPVLAMSAAYHPQAGATFDAISAKPFDSAVLLALINTQLRRAARGPSLPPRAG